MQFNVPQFIEHEARIVGPLTFKQFIYLGVAVVVAFITYRSASFPVFILVTLIVGGLAVALAFLKVGGLPFPKLISNFLKFTTIPKIYIWQKKDKAEVQTYDKVKPKAVKKVKKSSPVKVTRESRLKKLQSQIEVKKTTDE